ncbi:MAG: HNH endonuclease signature motif containing protein [Bacteroidetes bacterium]|nr:HNH endonuclease signature motif containing protein [Bacteroidota bacterium]
MKKIISLIFSFLLFVNVLFAQHYKKDGTPDKRYKENRTSTHTGSYSKKRSSNKTYYTNTSVKRDKNGKIKRSSSAKHEFMKQTGYPKGRKGYVVDHIVPLKKGGCDCPSNMQWQTIEDAKKKDKWE